jgi:hypothetical protein
MDACGRKIEWQHRRRLKHRFHKRFAPISSLRWLRSMNFRHQLRGCDTGDGG